MKNNVVMLVLQLMFHPSAEITVQVPLGVDATVDTCKHMSDRDIYQHVRKAIHARQKSHPTELFLLYNTRCEEKAVPVS